MDPANLCAGDRGPDERCRRRIADTVTRRISCFDWSRSRVRGLQRRRRWDYLYNDFQTSSQKSVLNACAIERKIRISFRFRLVYRVLKNRVDQTTPARVQPIDCTDRSTRAFRAACRAMRECALKSPVPERPSTSRSYAYDLFRRHTLLCIILCTSFRRNRPPQCLAASADT